MIMQVSNVCYTDMILVQCNINIQTPIVNFFFSYTDTQFATEALLPWEYTNAMPSMLLKFVDMDTNAMLHNRQGMLDPAMLQSPDMRTQLYGVFLSILYIVVIHI